MREMDIEPRPSDEPIVMRERESGLKTLAIAAAMIAVFGVGVYVLANAPNDQRVAMNYSEAVTMSATPDGGKTDTQ